MTIATMPPGAGKDRPRGLRQSMSGLHIWTGLLLGWLLYAMFLTGTVSFFREEISQWMRPEAPAWVDRGQSAAIADRLGTTMASIAPGASTWSITLPDGRRNVSALGWTGAEGLEMRVSDPATGRQLYVRETTGGDFFYRFHFSFHYIKHPWGRWLAGFAAMFMLVAIMSGVITHAKIFADFFTFRWSKGQRSWLDAHNGLSVLGLPFHAMITYTGLVTLMFLYVPWGFETAYPETQDRTAFAALRSSYVTPAEPSGTPARLAPLGQLVLRAESYWQGGKAGAIQVNNPGDTSARVIVTRRDSDRLSINPNYVVFDGASGDLIRTAGADAPAAQTFGVMYGLHLGRFADIVTRWLYFFLSLAGTAMVGTGLVLWTVKRRTKLADPNRPYLGFRVVERLNIATIAGLPLAMTAYLWGNRLLPTHLADRADWEIHLFFIVWALALVWATLRSPRRAWVELFWTAACLLMFTPLLNIATSSRGLHASIASGDWVFAGMDLAMLAFAAFAATVSRRTALHRAKPAKRRARAGSAVEAQA